MKMQPESEKVLSSREIPELNENVILHLYRTISILSLHLVSIRAARLHRLIPYCLRLLSNNLYSERVYITRFDEKCNECRLFYKWQKNNPGSSVGPGLEALPSSFVYNEYLKEGAVVFIGYYNNTDITAMDDNRFKIYPGLNGEIHIPIQNRKKIIGVLSFDKMQRHIVPTPQLIHPMKIAALLLANILLLNQEKEKSCSKTTFIDIYKLQEIHTLQQMVSLKNKLISTVSHEMRTPLTGIIGLTQALRMSGISLTEKEKDTFLGIIENEGKRLAALIRDLLDMSVSEMDGMKLSLSNFSLNELIAEAVLLFDNPSGKKQIVTNLMDDVNIKADKDRIKQVLIILMDNALKHGGDHCMVSTSKDKNDKRVIVSVADDGPGILINDQKRIFDSFYTTGSIKKNQPKSMGLGLAIAKQIIESHGGIIRVESVPGNGCTFLFTLDVNE